MSKYVRIPGFCKGAFPPAELCRILSGEVPALEPGAQIFSAPAADGGKGAGDPFLTAVGGVASNHEGAGGTFSVNSMPQPFETVRELAGEPPRIHVDNLTRYTERLR